MNKRSLARLLPAVLFACAAEEADTTGPVVKQVQFADADGELAPVKAVGTDTIHNAPAGYTFIRLIFDGLLDPTTVETLDPVTGASICLSAGNIKLFGPGEEEIPTEVCYDPSLPGVVIHPGQRTCAGFAAAEQWERGQTYTVQVGAGIKDAAGNPIASQKRIRFSVAKRTEVVATQPLFKDIDGDGKVDARTDVALDAAISLVFSDFVGQDPTGIDLVYNDGEVERRVSADVLRNDDLKTLVAQVPLASDKAIVEVLPWMSLLPNTRYDVRVSEDFLDEAGAPVIVHEFWFRTRPADFTVQGEASVPAAGSTSAPRDLVWIGSPIGNCLHADTPDDCKGGAAWIALSDMVDPESVTTETVKFYKTATGESVPGYTVEVATGEDYAEYNGVATDGEHLRLIGVRLPIDPATGLTRLLEPDTEYTIELTGGIKSKQRTDNPPRALKPAKVGFRTAKFQVGMPFLNLRLTTPAPRTIDVPVTTPRVRLHFSEPVDPATADGSKVAVYKCATDACGADARFKVAGTWTLNPDVMGVHASKDDGPVNGYFSSVPADALDFVPTVPETTPATPNWDWNTKYLIVAEAGVRNAAGAELGTGFETAFFTASFNASVKAPANGATDVAADARIEAKFNGPVAPATFTRESFTVREVTGKTSDGREILGPPIEGTYAADPTGTAVAFTPSAPLKPATQYRATVTTAVRSSHGTTDAKKALARPLTWTFWTSCL